MDEPVNELTWLTKQEACTLTKISLRTIEREISLGNVRTKQRRQIGRRSVTILHPEDVEKLRQDFTPLTATVENGEEGASDLPALRQGGAVVALLESLKPLLKEQRLFLTLKDAATYTGLPEGQLRQLIKAREVPLVGQRPQYVRVRDLERL